MKDYQFTTDWFTEHIGIWEELLAEYKGKPCRALEIGCFEGRSTTWLLDNILTHEKSSITCIDTFTGSREFWNYKVSFPDVRSRFFHNIKEANAEKKVCVITGESQNALMGMKLNSYDLAYIDGSHATADVFLDIAFTWKLIKTGGIIILDDYLWNQALVFNPITECEVPKPAIDAFLRCFADQIDLLTMGMQVIVRKVVRRVAEPVRL